MITTKPYSITYSRFRFTLRAEDDARLPAYLGSTLRGAMGRAFRRGSCLSLRSHCSDCMFSSRCAYAYIFETSQASTINKGAGVEHFYIPHPFVIEPPLDGKTIFKAGEELTFDLLLIGSGLHFFPFFIAAFAQAAAEGLGAGRHRFRLENVAQWLDDELVLLWNGGNRLLGNPVAQVLTNDLEAGIDCREITLHLQTPLRIKERGHLVNEISFPLLIRSIFRRLDLLGRVHGDGPLILPYTDYLQQAAAVSAVPEANSLYWTEWRRYSNRQKVHMNMGGYCGSIRYQGDLGPFLPYLKMAAVLHLGKGTVYGLGKIAIEVTER
jgi:hypothetical protein